MALNSEVVEEDAAPGQVHIADKIDVDRPAISGKKVLCNFFKLEHPDDILPDMECGFEACDPRRLGANIRREHPSVVLGSAQDLFRELWESQRENREDEIKWDQGYDKKTLPDTVQTKEVQSKTLLVTDNMSQDEEIMESQKPKVSQQVFRIC